MAARLEGGAYLSSFVDAISKKLSSILEDDFVLEGNDSSRKLLEKLDDYLCDVEPVLDDAELKQFRNDRVKKWLVDLHDALYMADDFLDELCTKAATATPGNSSSWSRPVDSIIEDSGVNVIEKIVGKLDSVVRQKGKLGLEKSAKLDTSWRLPSTHLVVSSDIFGRDQDKDNIIKLLLDDTCDAESPVTVIPIVGMGGIGKTTLAQLVYKEARVVGKFDIRAWVCVAENPDPVHVTRTLIGAIGSVPLNLHTFDSLQTHLKEKLTGKTFLVVLDDVWDHRPDLWEDFLKPFRYGDNGSKILLTTRNENVASVLAAKNLHYQLSLLSEEDCWLVFLKHSSISINSKQYATLEPIGRKIVEKCKGLPLAVKTLGSLLRNKCDREDWEKIHNNKIWELSEINSMIAPALRISYHYLPSHLKRCFVYCSLYSEDYEFDKDKLILLWMAEDLLQPEKNNTLENIGCAYFDELVARSFFQPSTNGKLFVIHDLMLDLAMFFAGKFYFKLKEFDDRYRIDSKTRHLSCATKYEDRIKLFQEICNGAIDMRTILDFTSHRFGRSIDIENSWLLLQQLGCLRVLSFGNFSLESLPDESIHLSCLSLSDQPIVTLSESIGELIHLRYLNLSFASIKTLPESICKLYNLQTLKLRGCPNLEMLPSRIQDLVNLRHLDIRGASGLKEMPKGMSKLKHLNFLSDYIVGEHEENGIRELGTLDNLHGSFCISKLENVKKSGEALEAKMGNKKHIKTLKLKWLPDGDIDDAETERDILDKLQPHENLEELSIEGYRGETFPDWLGLSRYSNITKLTLEGCKNCCELPSLGQLPSLQHLEVYKLDGLEKIDFELYNKNNASLQQEIPFKSLETLKIQDMCGWREWHFPDEFDGFPQLRILSIMKCPVLRGDLPAHLPALEKLYIEGCSELACSLPRAPKLHQLSVCDSTLTFSEQQQHKTVTEIQILRCGSLTLFPMAGFPNLEELIIITCKSMEKLNFEVPQALPNLLRLTISDCSSLVSLSALGLAAPHLQELYIEDCPKLDSFAEECLPPSLKTLYVLRCEKLASWITSKGLQSEGLTHLILEEWNEVKWFPRVSCLPASLETLTLKKFPNLETLDGKGLHYLTSLKYLSIRDCEKLENIREKHWLASIENIYMGEECPLRRKLEEMEHPRIQFIPYEFSLPCPRYYYMPYGFNISPDTNPPDTNPPACSVQ